MKCYSLQSVDEPVVYRLGLAVKLQEKTSFALNSN